MLIVNPDERVNITDVVKYCSEQLEIIQKKETGSQRSTPLRMVNNKSSISNKDDLDGDTGPRRPTIDPCLIMDDIIEKLQLLDYNSKFCATRGHKTVSRTYFAIKHEETENSETKIAYMIELCYWLMSLGFEDSQRKEHRRKGS